MKQHRTEVINVLRQQMEAETDPQKKVEYAKQLAKLLPRPRQARRPRKPKATSPSKKTWWVREIYTGSVFDAMSDDELLVHHIVVLSEKKQKELKTSTKEAIAEVIRSLPENHRADWESLNTEEGKAQITQHQMLLNEAKDRARARMGKDC